MWSKSKMVVIKIQIVRCDQNSNRNKMRHQKGGGSSWSTTICSSCGTAIISLRMWHNFLKFLWKIWSHSSTYARKKRRTLNYFCVPKMDGDRYIQNASWEKIGKISFFRNRIVFFPSVFVEIETQIVIFGRLKLSFWEVCFSLITCYQ